MCAAGRASASQPPQIKITSSDSTNSGANNNSTTNGSSSNGPKSKGLQPDQQEITWMSNIVPLNLEENPASGRGRYSSVSVLQPTMRIERTGDVETTSDPIDTGTIAVYRIVASFIFEVAIFGFDQEFQKYNRFFDNVSLRCLFQRGDEIDLRPHSDPAVSGVKVTNEHDQTGSIDVGVSANMNMAAVPTLSVQAQRDFKLSYQRTMSSWRMGLSFEEYPLPAIQEKANLPLGSKLATYLLPKSQQQLPVNDENIRKYPRQDLQRTFFQVLSPHARGCHCQPYLHDGCPLQHRRRASNRFHHSASYYNRAAHWFWQTEASLRLWTPEIYSSFRVPITVMREVPVDVIDSLRRLEDLRPYLHFDFEADTQLRVLGVSGLNWFKSARRPAELRAQSDTGQQLPRDRVRFCLTCCAENISWPLYPTRNLQAEAEAEVLRGRIPRRLQTNSEFYAYLRRQHQAKQAALHKSPAATSPDKRDPQAASGAASHTLLRTPTDAPHDPNHPVNATYPAWKVSEVIRCRCQNLDFRWTRMYHCCSDCPVDIPREPKPQEQERLRRDTPESPPPSSCSPPVSPQPVRSSIRPLTDPASLVPVPVLPVPDAASDIAYSVRSSIDVEIAPMSSPRAFVDGRGLAQPAASAEPAPAPASAPAPAPAPAALPAPAAPSYNRTPEPESSYYPWLPDNTTLQQPSATDQRSRRPRRASSTGGRREQQQTAPASESSFSPRLPNDPPPQQSSSASQGRPRRAASTGHREQTSEQQTSSRSRRAGSLRRRTSLELQLLRDRRRRRSSSVEIQYAAVELVASEHRARRQRERERDRQRPQ